MKKGYIIVILALMIFMNIFLNISHVYAIDPPTAPNRPATCEHTGGEATCTSGAKCSLCGEEYTSALGHDYNNVNIGATCTEGGSNYDECSTCGDIKNVNTWGPLGHKGGIATCIAKAVCDRCSESYGEINPNNHVNIEWTDFDEPHTTEGHHKKTCNDCATVLIEGEHNYGGEGHTCVCPYEYAYGPEHRFDAYGGSCQAYKSGCTKTFTAKVSFDQPLPKKR